MITVALPYPDKSLWPNGRAHPMAKARAFKKHKGWANVAALSALPVRHPEVFAGEHTLPVRIVITGKPKGPMPDADNAVAASKAYLDGIAARIGVNDRRFAAPTVEFSGRSEHGGFQITIGGGNAD